MKKTICGNNQNEKKGIKNARAPNNIGEIKLFPNSIAENTDRAWR